MIFLFFDNPVRKQTKLIAFNTGIGNIQLAMCETSISSINGTNTRWLSLGFIYRLIENKSHWKLQSFKVK